MNDLYQPDGSLYEPDPQDQDIEAELEELERLAGELEVLEIERDLRKFIPLAWKVIEPHKQFVPGYHIDAIADHLMACTEGHIQNLVINIPPRHMKSLTVSVFWPAWEWIRMPGTKWLFVSYARNLVVRDSVKTRRILQSPFYQQHWRNRFRLSTDQNVKSYYENDQGGSRIVGSIDSGITGEGGDRLVVDDALKLEDSDNKDAIANVNDFWDGVLASRINDAKTGCRVIIMQRLNDGDLTGHVLREGGWTWLYLPTEFETNRRCMTIYKRDVYNPETNETVTVTKEFKDPRRYEGELLNPERFGHDEVEKIKIRNGPWRYSGQQQQRPVPQGGGMFHRDWWGYYDVDNAPSIEVMQDDACQSWDCSFKDLESSSFVVGTAWSRVGIYIHLLGRERARMDFPTTVKAVKIFTARFPWIGPKLIEDKANGIAVISVLQSEVRGILARKVPDGGVHALASAVSYMVASGNVLLPGKRDENGNLVPAFPWVLEFIIELESYPKGDFSDQVASAAHALYYYHERPVGGLDLDGLMGEGEGVDPNLPDWIF